MNRRILFLAVFLPCFASAQHDVQRNAVQRIAKGSYEEAARTLGGGKKPNAGEAETRFVEMLSLLHQDKAEEAMDKAWAAVEAGLPFERLLAGPAELLGKLHVRDDFKTWKFEIDPPALLHGPMLGSVTDSSASFWVRTDGPASVIVRLSETGKLASGNTSAENGNTAVLTIDGLDPGVRYEYEVFVNAEKQTLEETAFETYPAAGKTGRFSVGFGGGAGYIPEWERMWDTIREFRPAAFLMLGDNVYIDQPEHAMTNLYCYTRRQSRPEWRRFVAGTSMHAIYDDHDFGTNDCVPGPGIEDPPWKREVWKIFRDNWVNPAYGGGEDQPGCWHDFRIGDVHFILLDGRYYRDLEGGSMLGLVQKQWLFETLKNSEGTFKVIASPVPFTEGIKKGSRDPWDGFPEEREEIFSFLESEAIGGVFLVAADRHRTDLRVTKRPNGYDLYEFESSRLTNRHTHSVVKTEGLLWGYNKTCSFGLMRFDTTREDPQVTFQGINIDGEPVGEFVLKRSVLGKR